MPHVVIATRLYHPESAAAALRLKVMADAFAENGAEVTVLTTRVGEHRTEKQGSVTVSRWPVRRDAMGIVRGYVSYMTFDIPLLWRLATVRHPDLVVSEPPPTTGAVVRAVCALRRVPYVYYAADIWSDAVAAMEAPQIVGTILRRIEQFALRGASTVLAISEGVKERTEELGARATLLVPNGIDTQLFTPDGPKLTEAELDEIGVTEGNYLVYAGTASEWQGAGIFIDAFRRVRDELPDLKLVYMGQGSDWDAITTAAGDLGSSVVMLPARPPEEAARVMRSAAGVMVSIRPGIGYDFAYPTKVLAGLACGTPVVYAGVGPAVEHIREHTLGEVADFDADAVADAMRRLVRWPDEPSRPARLHAWVEENRSMRTAARHAVGELLAGIAASGARRRARR